MNEYKIPSELAHLLAVGLFQSAERFIRDADPSDLEAFRADYETALVRSRTIIKGSHPRGST